MLHSKKTRSVARSTVIRVPVVPPYKPAIIDPIPRVSYSVPEAAQALGVSDSTVKRLINSGKLASVKAMGRRVIPVKSINDFLSA